MITQFDTEENELFNYYEGNDISTRALVDFMASDEASKISLWTISKHMVKQH